MILVVIWHTTVRKRLVCHYKGFVFFLFKPAYLIS